MPKKLYHYTSISSFLSIVKSGQLWFTDFRCMNDLSELKYGLDLIIAELDRHEGKETDNALRELYASLSKEFERPLEWVDIFLFSLCREHNLLNQWRVYNQDTVPISIEFESDALCSEEWEHYSFSLVPMIYDLSVQQGIVDAAISAGVSLALKNGGKNFDVETFTAACVDWCMQMKQPQFEVEGEWRLVTRWGLNHRASPLGIVPYLAMKPNKGGLPITGITLGPCANPEIQMRALRDFLRVQSYEFVEVMASDLPIRP